MTEEHSWRDSMGNLSDSRENEMFVSAPANPVYFALAHF